MKPALIYARYSPRKAGDQCESIENQLSICRRFCDLQGLNVVNTYTDQSVSARLVPLGKREAGAEMVATLEHFPAALVAYRLDRLFRNVRDGINCLERFRRMGVDVYFASEGGQSLNTATATGRLVINFLLSVAAFEPELTAERTSDAIKRRRRDNLVCGGSVPYGWQRVPGSDCLKVINSEFAVIEAMHALYSNGRVSYREIAERLTALGYVNRAGKPWHPMSIKRILERSEGVSTDGLGVLPSA